MSDCLDAAKMEAFAERVVGFLNGGALALMVSIWASPGEAVAPATSRRSGTSFDPRW